MRPLTNIAFINKRPRQLAVDRLIILENKKLGEVHRILVGIINCDSDASIKVKLQKDAVLKSDAVILHLSGKHGIIAYSL